MFFFSKLNPANVPWKKSPSRTQGDQYYYSYYYHYDYCYFFNYHYHYHFFRARMALLFSQPRVTLDTMFTLGTIFMWCCMSVDREFSLCYPGCIHWLKHMSPFFDPFCNQNTKFCDIWWFVTRISHLKRSKDTTCRFGAFHKWGYPKIDSL